MTATRLDTEAVLAPYRVRPVLTVAIVLVLGVTVVTFARWGPDWPAQEFRAWVALHDGLTSWTSRWYGGVALPGYSVLYPVFGVVAGPGATGVLAVAATAWAAGVFAPAGRVRGRLFAVAVPICLAGNLLIGQVPFLMGTAFGALALRALITRQRWMLVAMLAVLCSLASPLAGLSLLLIAPASVSALGWRRAMSLGGACVGIAVSSLVGGAEGPFPMMWATLLETLSFCAVLAATVARRPRLRPLVWFALTYAVAAIAMFLIPNPVGGNIVRLAKLAAIPLAIFLLAKPATRVTRAGTAVIVAGALVWPGAAVVSSIEHGSVDPSRSVAYYTGLLEFLHTQAPLNGRIEIPFTRGHWEAMWVARSFPIARGWERQTDLLYDAALYSPLTPAAYLRWLDDNAVSLVALPTAPIDYGGQAEATLLARPPAYLHPVWHDTNWQVWRVTDPRPIVTGATLATTITSSTFALRFADAATAVVRIHASTLWHVTQGSACVDATPGGWLRVRARSAGEVRLSASLNDAIVGGDQQECAN